MDDHEAEFVEAMAGQLAGASLPPIAARMWAWLLICDPPQQTAAAMDLGR